MFESVVLLSFVLTACVVTYVAILLFFIIYASLFKSNTTHIVVEAQQDTSIDIIIPSHHE